MRFVLVSSTAEGRARKFAPGLRQLVSDMNVFFFLCKISKFSLPRGFVSLYRAVMETFFVFVTQVSLRKKKLQIRATVAILEYSLRYNFL